MKTVAHAYQLLTDSFPYGRVGAPFQLAGVDGLFEAEATHRPVLDDEGQPTGNRVLEIKVYKIA